MAESKKQPAKRPDGGVCIHRSVGLPKSRVFYGKTKAEAERKYQDAVLAYKLECMDRRKSATRSGRCQWRMKSISGARKSRCGGVR